MSQRDIFNTCRSLRFPRPRISRALQSQSSNSDRVSRLEKSIPWIWQFLISSFDKLEGSCGRSSRFVQDKSSFLS
ncbi:hypothetical protein EUGRSUZ_E03139 [Eucalyptus grandis]|uniref:Uncharacterized protein n=2 Tax=Eucalyptus grandis TaxID=71139 RepID=A0ACC3KYX3_EUCGR|nr:hypothetical protein EUGRSUZ_E03139 [Eucalyptus grandis]